jgi:hypothetical protein
LTKNFFNGIFQQEVNFFGTELFNLCKQKQFHIESADIFAMPSFTELFNRTPKQTQGYLATSIERFYSDILEPTKVDLTN